MTNHSIQRWHNSNKTWPILSKNKKTWPSPNPWPWLSTKKHDHHHMNFPMFLLLQTSNPWKQDQQKNDQPFHKKMTFLIHVNKLSTDHLHIHGISSGKTRKRYELDILRNMKLQKSMNTRPLRIRVILLCLAKPNNDAKKLRCVRRNRLTKSGHLDFFPSFSVDCFSKKWLDRFVAFRDLPDKPPFDCIRRSD